MSDLLLRLAMLYGSSDAESTGKMETVLDERESMIEYTIDIDHSIAHVLADGLARLSAADDAEKRIKTYEGVFSDDHELRNTDGYRKVLELAIDAVNALIAVSDAETPVTIVVGEM